MSIQEVSPEYLAELFHHYHQALAPDFGCTSPASNQVWARVPEHEKNRLVAAARLTLLELSSAQNKGEDSGRYFAKPGQAEWVVDVQGSPEYGQLKEREFYGLGFGAHSEQDFASKIHERRNRAGPSFARGDRVRRFRIDIGSRSVTLREEKLELTSEEFDVLVFLVSHPQGLITPYTILATSWATKPPRADRISARIAVSA